MPQLRNTRDRLEVTYVTEKMNAMISLCSNPFKLVLLAVGMKDSKEYLFLKR